MTEILDVQRDPTFVGGDVATFEVNFSRIAADGRFDADRFHPKYDRLFSSLKASGLAVRLGDWLSEKPKRGAQPRYDPNGDIFVINSQQVHLDKIDLASTSRTTEAGIAAAGNKGRVKKYDVLLNSTGYLTIGRCQCFLDDVPAVVDSHVAILRPREGLDPVYLAAFINSRVGYLQTERAWTGSSGQIELLRESIEDFIVLIPPREIQLSVRKQIEEAHAARVRANKLIEGSLCTIEELAVPAAVPVTGDGVNEVELRIRL